MKVKSFISFLQELVETLLIYDWKLNEEARLDLLSNFETEKSENVKENDIDEKIDVFSANLESYEDRWGQRLMSHKSTDVRPSIVMKKPL